MTKTYTAKPPAKEQPVITAPLMAECLALLRKAAPDSMTVEQVRAKITAGRAVAHALRALEVKGLLASEQQRSARPSAPVQPVTAATPNPRKAAATAKLCKAQQIADRKAAKNTAGESSDLLA